MKPLSRLTIFLLFLSILYASSFIFCTGLKISQAVVLVITIALLFLKSDFIKIKTLFLPLTLTSMLYDSQRLYSQLLRGPIHVREPYQFDLRFFSIKTHDTPITPNEWCQLHVCPTLDFFCGIAYLTFIPEFFLIATYFLYSKKNPHDLIAKQMLWGFFWLNLIGYSTYYWYPAAPPWYVSLYGFGPANLSVPANLAGCARFDTLIGLPLFKTWYGQSADVFGSIPSLHVAYPFLAVIFTFKARKLRLFSLLFYFLISFAAIYLNHHYVLDVLCGTGYAILVSCGMSYWHDLNHGEK